MSAQDDPALYKSDYIRHKRERYFTEPWVTNALLNVASDRLLEVSGELWEPACGRGDMSKIFVDFGFDVVQSDIDMSEADLELCPSYAMDFLKHDAPDDRDIQAIITNPPYGKPKGEKGRDYAEQFVRRALDYPTVSFVAMLLRSEFNSADRRTDLFEGYPFAYEIVLTSRPRWDEWWTGEPPLHGPRHNFSWFVWDREFAGRSTTFFQGKKRRKK